MARSSGQALDPADLHVRRRLDLVLGHHWPGVAADDLGLDVEALELLDDLVLDPAVGGLVSAERDRLRRIVEQVLAGRDVAAGPPGCFGLGLGFRLGGRARPPSRCSGQAEARAVLDRGRGGAPGGREGRGGWRRCRRAGRPVLAPDARLTCRIAAARPDLATTGAGAATH